MNFVQNVSIDINNITAEEKNWLRAAFDCISDEPWEKAYDWADDGYMETLAADGDEVRVGALGDQDAEPSHEEYFSFDDLDERVEERTADVGAGAGASLDPAWDADDD